MKLLRSPLAMSLALHVIMLGMLLFSVDFHTPKPQVQAAPQMQVIEAVAISEQAVQERIDKIREAKAAQKRAEQQRIEAQRREQREAEARRLQAKREAEEKARRLKEQKLAEKRRAEAEAQRQREAEERRRQEEAERKRQEQAAAERRERERREQERRMQEQLEAEQAARARRNSQQVQSELQKYRALIQHTIQRHLIVDQSMKGKSCRLNIRLASNGLVTQVKVLNGDPIVCRAAQNAVYKNDTLPVSDDPDVYAQLKDINLTVEPQL